MRERWQCTCGSGLAKRKLIDARGIFCTFVCDRCEATKRRGFRAEIFTDANYEADEPIDDDDPQTCNHVWVISDEDGRSYCELCLADGDG